MNPTFFNRLYGEGLISDASFQKVKESSQNNYFSLHWELRTILYLGVLLLSGGLGIWIYKNIDSIGHLVLLLLTTLVCAGCFYYCFRKKNPFTRIKSTSPNSAFDYILLLGCLTFLTLIAYLQAQYVFFGTAYGLATFIPMLVLFFCAYRFDHLGVLSMGVVNLAAWAGIAITPATILRDNDFSNTSLIYTGMVLGVLLVLAGELSVRKNLKAHFQFTYTNFGAHILFISLLAALFSFEGGYLLWLPLLLVAAWYFYKLAMKTSSFYFLLIITLYTYIAFSYTVIQILLLIPSYDASTVYLGLFYFIGSAIAVVRLLIILNRKMKQDDSLEQHLP